jgi:glyoxylase-like metal-dependent hydrolase (beta-lactamase superfamily II)
MLAQAGVAACLAVAVVGAAPTRAGAQADPLDVRGFVDEPVWRLWAVEYARSADIPERRLVRRAPAGARVDMSWYFFVAVGHGRVILVDCGTDALARAGRAELRQRWSIATATRVAEALGRLGLVPSDVTDVVLTHFHWDHAGGLPRFERARVHAHPREWRSVAAHVRAPVEAGGRLRPVDRSPCERFPGFVLREAGRHTAHQLMARIDCASGPVVIAGDAAYLYRNVEGGLPVTQTTSATDNVTDVRAAVAEVGAARVLPGHDPALFTRHPSGVDGVAAICR